MGTAFAWSLRAYSRKIIPTSRGFVDRMMSFESKGPHEQVSDFQLNDRDIPEQQLLCGF